MGRVQKYSLYNIIDWDAEKPAVKCLDIDGEAGQSLV